MRAMRLNVRRFLMLSGITTCIHAALLTTSCAWNQPLGVLGSLPQTGSLHPTASSTGSQAPDVLPWSDLVRVHTRRGVVYSDAGLLRQFDLRATLMTPRLLTAWENGYADAHGRELEGLERTLYETSLWPSLSSETNGSEGNPVNQVDQAESGAPEPMLWFLVSSYVTDQPHRDLGATYSIWDITATWITPDGQKETLYPKVIDEQRFSPAMTELLPHTNDFDDIYAIGFPVSAFMLHDLPPWQAGGQVELHVKSALASTSLLWQLQ